MRLFYLIIFACFFVCQLTAQKLPGNFRIKNGELSKDKNLIGKKVTSEQFAAIRFQKKFYVLLQFDRLPLEADKKMMLAKGIRLFDFLPPKGYLAEFSDSTAINSVGQHHATAVYSLPSSLKIAPSISADPGRSEKDADLYIAVSFFGSVDKNAVSSKLQELGAQVAFTKIQPNHILYIKAPENSIAKIAALPFVNYLGEQILKDAPLNYNNRATHSLDALNATSGRNLQGKNVVVGIGDNADPSGHIDFAGRLIVRTPEPLIPTERIRRAPLAAAALSIPDTGAWHLKARS